MSLERKNLIKEYLTGIYYPKTKVVMIEASIEQIRSRMEIAFYKNIKLFDTVAFRGHFKDQDNFEINSTRGRRSPVWSRGLIYSNKEHETYVQLKTESVFMFQIWIPILAIYGIGMISYYLFGNGGNFQLFTGLFAFIIGPIIMIGYAKGMVIALEEDFIEFVTRKEKNN